MSSQQVCSPTYQKGFINIAGNVSLQSLTTEDNIKPITASFAPRNTPPSLLNNFVDESNQNTILYNSYRYMLVSGGVQICTPSHIGLIPQNIGGTPELELILTYYTTQTLPISEPKVILLVIPVFSTSSQSQHAAYIRQFIDPDENPTASLQTIFFENQNDKSQSSIAYNTSVQLTDDNKKPQACLVMRVFYYPNGIRMTGQDFFNFKSILTQSDKLQIPKYSLPSLVRNNLPIATGYDTTTQAITIIASNGTMPITQMTIADIGNKLEYFKQPMSLSGTKDFSSSCPYYKTTQYKCVPFHKLSDLSGNYVIKNANTLDDILKQQDETSGVNKESSVSIKNIFIYLSITVGIVLVVVVLGAGVRWLSSKKPPRVAPVAAAAVATTVASVASATITNPMPVPTITAPSP